MQRVTGRRRCDQDAVRRKCTALAVRLARRTATSVPPGPPVSSDQRRIWQAAVSDQGAGSNTFWNCARPTGKPRQRIDTQSEGRSLETTAS